MVAGVRLIAEADAVQDDTAAKMVLANQAAYPSIGKEPV